MTAAEAESILEWVEYHEKPRTRAERLVAFSFGAKARGFRKTSTAASAPRLHEAWETAGRVYA
jgi:hypothetical protein